MAQVEGVVRARRAAATSLLTALRQQPAGYREVDLAQAWLREAVGTGDILASGWYEPPPGGVSVLIGSPPEFGRLNY